MLGHDRVGLGWRPELAAGILANLDRVDVVEVIADDHVDAGRRELRALRTLAIQVPLVLQAKRESRPRRGWLARLRARWREGV